MRGNAIQIDTPDIDASAGSWFFPWLSISICWMAPYDRVQWRDVSMSRTRFSKVRGDELRDRHRRRFGRDEVLFGFAEDDLVAGQ